MNNLHFKVGLIAFLFPVLLLAQTPDQTEIDQILDRIGQNLPADQTTNTAPSPALLEYQNKINGTEDISDADKEFLKFREGETADQYIQRIRVENLQREINGETKLPDPLISTTQIPQGPERTNVTPLDWQPADFLRDTDNNTVEDDFLKNNPLSRLFPPGMFKDQTTPLGLLLNQLFYAGLAVAVILAVVMIIVGGVQYMTIDAAAQKDTGKKRVQAALGGLVLAFSAILILNTINPNLTKLSLIFEEIKAPSSTTTDGLPVTSGSRPGTTGGSFSNFTDEELKNYTAQKIRDGGLEGLNPSDKAAFFPNGGTEEEWLALVTAMIKHESNFNTNTTYTENFTDSKGNYVISTGLLQLSQESVRGYANFNSSLGNITTQDLKNPEVNLDAGITILKRLVERDGCISCVKGKNSEGETIYGGGAAYWSVLRPTGKLEEVKATMRGN